MIEVFASCSFLSTACSCSLPSSFQFPGVIALALRESRLLVDIQPCPRDMISEFLARAFDSVEKLGSGGGDRWLFAG